MVIMAVVVIMMMINLVVLKIRPISGIKLDNHGKRIASYNQVLSSKKRFFLQKFLQFLDSPFAVSDISIYICWIDNKSKSKNN